MKVLFDSVSFDCSTKVTKTYSTSFSTAVKMLGSSIRQDIYNIYGFVRFADEIVDSFHDYNKEKLLYKFESDLKEALNDKISLNPILNSFQHTVRKYAIDYELINTFIQSMKRDLIQNSYNTRADYEAYIYGSADVVGLMCLQVFVNGDKKKYEELKTGAMRLGSAFQKINFLRDLKEDFEQLNRSYFPNTNWEFLNESTKKEIIDDIELDFEVAFEAIKKLPIEARFGVYTAYRYYKRLLKKLKNTPSTKIKDIRIRVPNYQKIELLARCYVKYRLNLL